MVEWLGPASWWGNDWYSHALMLFQTPLILLTLLSVLRRRSSLLIFLSSPRSSTSPHVSCYGSHLSLMGALILPVSNCKVNHRLEQRRSAVFAPGMYGIILFVLSAFLQDMTMVYGQPGVSL